MNSFSGNKGGSTTQNQFSTDSRSSGDPHVDQTPGNMNPNQLRTMAGILADELRRPGSVGALGGFIPSVILRGSGDMGCCRGVSSMGQEEMATALGRLPAVQLQTLWNALMVVDQFKKSLRQW